MTVPVDSHEKPDVRCNGAQQEDPAGRADREVIPSFVFEEVISRFHMIQITLRYKVKLYFYPAKYFLEFF